MYADTKTYVSMCPKSPCYTVLKENRAILCLLKALKAHFLLSFFVMNIWEYSDFIGELFLRGGFRDFEGLADFLPINVNNFHGGGKISHLQSNQRVTSVTSAHIH